MKILFCTGELDLNFTATNKIAFEMAVRLLDKGHTCLMAGIALDSDPSSTVDRGVAMIRLNSTAPTDVAQQKLERYCSEHKGETRDKAKKAFMLRHPISAAVLWYKYSPFSFPQPTAASYKKQVKKIIQRENPDCIIVTYMPFFEAQGVFNSEVHCPIYAYQMDPWGLHRLPELCKDEAQHICQEVEIFQKARHIFTTPILLRQYAQRSEYQPYLAKMTPLDFPNIRKIKVSCQGKSAFNFEGNYTNIVYCGIIEDDYRSPETLLQGIKALVDRGADIRLYFVGINLSDSVKRFARLFPDWVFIHSPVPLDSAFATMAGADILLNISNTLDNQVPSKIFDYFSMGKPILNVQKIPDCPSREYFDRYPLSFTFDEKHPNIDGMGEFLIKAKGKSIDFSEVERLFPTATAQYAADVIEKIITTKGE
ncbi:MAG: hypothetical protein RR846_03570 [Oscillospiraceae bacterium]